MGSGPSLAHTICPLTGVPFVDPVIATDGQTYSREAITKWYDYWKDASPDKPVLSPITWKPMSKLELRPDVDAQAALETFRPEKLAKPGIRSCPAGDARTIGGQIVSLYEMHKVFTVVDSYCELLSSVTAAWTPPQLVVLGERGVGKSVLLERLLMKSLFPRGKGICTQACIQVRLRHALKAQTPRLEVINAVSPHATVYGPYPIATENGCFSVEKAMWKLIEDDTKAQEQQQLLRAEEAMQNRLKDEKKAEDEKLKKAKEEAEAAEIIKKAKEDAEAAEISNDSQEQGTDKAALSHPLEAQTKVVELRPEEGSPADESKNMPAQPREEVFHPENLVRGGGLPKEEVRREDKRCESRIIVIHVEGPHLPSIDLIDLPGLVNEPVDTALTTRSIIDAQLQGKEKRSLCLLAVPTSQNFARSAAVQVIEAFKLRDRTIGVLTHCDQDPKMVRNRLETGAERDQLQLRDFVGTANPCIEPEVDEAHRLSHGNLLRVQQQAQKESQFFYYESLADLEQKGLAGSNALQTKVSTMFNEYLLDTWASQTIWCLKRQRARLQFSVAVLGPPTPSTQADLERVRAGVTKAARAELQDTTADITLRVARSILDPLKKQIMDIIGAELSCAMDEHGDQWQSLQKQINEVCKNTVISASDCIIELVRAALEHEAPLPPWPSVEAEEYTRKLVMHVPARFPKFVNAAITELESLLGPWRRKLVDGMEFCIGKIFNVATPFVKMRSRLAADPPQMRMIFACEDIMGLLTSSLLRHDLCASTLIGQLSDGLAGVSEGLPGWIDTRKVERDSLRSKLERLEGTRKELVQLLGQTPPGLASLEEISLAHCSCTGVGTQYAWRKRSSQLTITVRGSSGQKLPRSMPAGHTFEATVQTQRASTVATAAEFVLKVPVRDNGDGTHTVVYTIPDGPVDQDMELSIQLYGNDVHGSPFKLRVSDDPDWTAREVLAPIGCTDALELKAPADISVFGDDIYVADQDSNCVYATHKDGQGLHRCVIADLQMPWGLVVDEDALYVVESGSDCVKVLGKHDGVLLQKFGSRGEGNGEFRSPRGLCLDGDSAFVTDSGNHRVQVLVRRKGGTFSLERCFGSEGSAEGQFQNPCGLAVDGPRIHVCDQDNNRVQVFAKCDGYFMYAYGAKGSNDAELWNPTSVVVDGPFSYVSDFGNSRIQVFDKMDGKFITTIGAKGRSNGFLREPAGLAIHNGKLFVSEKGNRRVQVFSSTAGVAEPAAEQIAGEIL